MKIPGAVRAYNPLASAEEEYDVSVSIVTFNSREFIGGCLDSVYRNASHLAIEVIVVDNASGDGTVWLVREEYPQVNLIQNDQNVGFARAQNQALRLGTGRYRLLLNPDTILLPRALDTMVDFLDRNPSVGAVAPVQWSDEERTLAWSYVKLPNPATIIFQYTLLGRLFPNNPLYRREWEYDRKLLVSQSAQKARGLPGGCLLVSRRCIEDVGLLDEGYFLFIEDADWTMRMDRRGWPVYVLPQAEIIHYLARSIVYLDNIQSIMWQGLRRYLRKYHGQLWLMVVDMAVEINRRIMLLIPCVRHLVPNLRSGISDAVTRKGPGEIQWQRVADAEEYFLQVSLSRDFTYGGTTIIRGCQWKPTATLLHHWRNQTFYWRVFPVTADGPLGKLLATGVYRT
jgi:GT2 family glycosyltransferase